MSATENTEFHGGETVADLRASVVRIRTLAEELNATAGTDGNTVGAPCSAHRISQLKSALGLPDGQPLLQFYRLADGLNLMDCFNGIAIHSVAQLIAAVSDGYSPRSLGEVHCVCFGTTGGGDRFCVLKDTGEIVRLTEVAVEQGRADPEGWQLRNVARDVGQFFARVADDLSAWLEEREGHAYLSSP